MNFKKRLFISIAIPVAICLILAIVLLFIGSNIADRTAQIKKLRNDLFLRQQSTRSFADLSKQFEQVKNYLAQLENILPTQDELVSFPRDIAIIARQNKFDSSVSLGQENIQNSGGLRQTDFKLTGLGEFNAFTGFLKSLEKSRYFIKLNMLDISRRDDNLKILLSGQVFSF